MHTYRQSKNKEHLSAHP